MAGKLFAEHQGEAACPFHIKADAAPAETGSDKQVLRPREVLEFDPFDTAYQLDPVEALRWSRERHPVFFAPKLGYWVVTRYDDVKAVFRDNVTFSPSIALEKITPTSAEANAVLARHGYAMNRTLVNEDEPIHMERRRALLHSFLPSELAHHEPMVRRLAQEYVDRFIDRGRADLVNEMLWEVPLTVALHFLGVPEEDMDLLRRYSIAHTVNTWGRPTPEEQVAVAEAVGRFWTYAGAVLEKMRSNPDGPGWMHYAIRKQKELPEVVTDSYLHSMMMAGIVAAHETTANATGNALRLLLERRHLWDEICANPELIPNAVEECLRFSGSIIAWRRIAVKDGVLGGVDIPKGARLLLVMTSANHDERHFENPDEIDLYRDNPTDHLSFGYGSHQCMGKNLARMEMRVFLEELTRRLPHMELEPGQTFTYLPNVSFRGPEHLHVRWDPKKNPERATSALRTAGRRFEIGAPRQKDVARTLNVASVHREADDIIRIVLEGPLKQKLPAWSAGAHIDLVFGSFTRTYSLCGALDDPFRYQIAVLKEACGRGGSLHIHDALRPGMTVRVRGPRNHFRLNENADHYSLIAGGIGITPIIAMADRLKALGKAYTLDYCGRSRARMAFLERLQRDHGRHLRLHAAADGQRLDLASLVPKLPASALVYACGPDRLLASLTTLFASKPDHLFTERFSALGSVADASRNRAFEAELADSRLTITVKAEETLLAALNAHGIDVPSDCGEGLCGTCEVAVLAGKIDHRDTVLTAAERREGRRMMACCSRAIGERLVLAL